MLLIYFKNLNRQAQRPTKNRGIKMSEIFPSILQGNLRHCNAWTCFKNQRTACHIVDNVKEDL